MLKIKCLTSGMMDTMSNATVWVIVVTLMVAGVIDVWMTLYGPPGSTISETVWTMSQKYPMVPFLIGILVGHLLWPQRMK